MLILSHKSIHR